MENNLDRLPLNKLISVPEWQDIQDNFANIVGVSIRTVDTKGVLITEVSNPARLCSEILRDSPKKAEICHCLPTFLGGKAVVDKNLSFNCLPGIQSFVVPLTISESHAIGYVLVGPVILIMRSSKEDYRKLAADVDMDLEKVWDAILEIKVMSFHGINSLLQLLKGVGEYAVKLAHETARIKKEGGLVHDVTKLGKLPEFLLDVAFEISKADVGSIMFFDENRENLTIRASRGIPEDVVKNTVLKRGERICGTAAKEGKPFLIDDTIKDRRIKPYLNRPNLNSSMVLPVKTRKEVLGVMSLGAFRSSPVKFTQDSLSSMQKLLNLATLAWYQ